MALVTKKKHVGETARGIDIRLREHKRDIRNDVDNSALVLHTRKMNYLPKWYRASLLAVCRNRQKFKSYENSVYCYL